MKTYTEFESSKLELDEFLNDPCEIDEEMYLYLGEIVSPQYLTRTFVQVGEAQFEEDEVLFFRSLSCVDGRYYNLGILPEFKQ